MGKRTITVVMDKGFFSTRNINRMLKDSGNGSVNFLISIPFTPSFAKQQVESERKDIDCVENTIVINANSMRAVTKLHAYGKTCMPLLLFSAKRQTRTPKHA